MRVPLSWLWVVGFACTSKDKTSGTGDDLVDTDTTTTTTETGTPPTTQTTDAFHVADVAVEYGLQHTEDGFHRGRSCVPADFDLDGKVDLFFGNPGNISFLMMNDTPGGGAPHWGQGQILTERELLWSAAGGDFDNDGDTDLFSGGGGNEGNERNWLFGNNTLGYKTGAGLMYEVGVPAGVAYKNEGPLHDVAPSAGGVSWADFDNDGWLDLWVSGNLYPTSLTAELADNPGLGVDVLYMNNHDGTFRDISGPAGLWSFQGPSRHDAVFDMDNDGDLDVYDSTYEWTNTVLLNQFAETGEVKFIDGTAQMSGPGEDLHYPWNLFGSAPGDFNNDGWTDLLVLVRGIETESKYTDGHILFLNNQGKGFVDVSRFTNINESFLGVNYRNHQGDGVMGHQIGDWNADGILDLYAGNGKPDAGSVDSVSMSDGMITVSIPDVGEMQVPHYINFTPYVDFPAPEDPALVAAGTVYPPYPYRTHGICIADIDDDGMQEVIVMEGGRAVQDESVEEPVRIFKTTYDNPRHWLKIAPAGDGVRVNRSGIGARMKLTVVDPDGTERTLYNTMFGGSGWGFNGMVAYFGLLHATSVPALEVTWPDGAVSNYTDLPVDATFAVSRDDAP